MRLLARLPALDAWNAIADEELVSHTDAHDLLGTLERVSEKARSNTSGRFAAKSTEPTGDGGRRFVDAAPVLRRVTDAEAAAVAGALEAYPATLSEDRLPLLARYAVHASPSASSAPAAWARGRTSCCSWTTGANRSCSRSRRPGPPRCCRTSPPPASSARGRARGRRVVMGQKRMQVVSDILLGWTSVDGRPFQVRQFRNRKGSVDPAALAADQLDDYGRMTGACWPGPTRTAPTRGPSRATAARTTNWTRRWPSSPSPTPTAPRRTTRSWWARCARGGSRRSWGCERSGV